jgi:hypothetical protein
MIKDEKRYEFAHDCICAFKKKTKRYLADRGISEAFRKKTLKNFVLPASRKSFNKPRQSRGSM